VARAWPLGRRLLVERHALAFVQLVEAALHGTPMKEPLLSAVVANESETPVPNESLDRAAWHSSLLGRACVPKGPISNFVPPRYCTCGLDLSTSQTGSSISNIENGYAGVQIKGVLLHIHRD